MDERSIGNGIIAVPKCFVAKWRLLRKPVIDNSADGCNTVPTLLCKLFEGETLNDPLFEPSKVSSVFVTCIGPQERTLALMAVPSLVPIRSSAILFDPD